MSEIRLGGGFFFSRGQEGDQGKFSVIIQLTFKVARLRQHVNCINGSDPTLHTKSMDVQLQEHIVNTSQILSPFPILIKCHDKVTQQLILQLLCEMIVSSAWARIHYESVLLWNLTKSSRKDTHQSESFNPSISNGKKSFLVSYFYRCKGRGDKPNRPWSIQQWPFQFLRCSWISLLRVSKPSIYIYISIIVEKPSEYEKCIP